MNMNYKFPLGNGHFIIKKMSLTKNIQIFIKNIIFHTPKEKLNDVEIKFIEENGLIHFCKKADVKSICKEGVKPGIHPMLAREKNFTWFYINDDESFEKNKKIIHSKGKRKYYNTCVLIKNLSKEQINDLRIRRKIDNAVVYPGVLKTDDMHEK